ncbi:TfoX/Sxy family protein [Dactylosporangium vinaceum]|uniref:TfoX/Sxy family protein n=1 Tax=Dactylosporangium vinaceum TaxID=53362 RepID=A0ABV5MS44_9ACTN|nr:TfoX/Sxy family protein [Dactylosporangium vinaceum]UAC00256.1 TfoX/Sxy family protein [Dactylosporangium vinaceum]
MAYDEELAGRIRQVVQHESGLTERRMFGGLAFLVNGNLAVSASGHGGLLVRVDPADTARLLRRVETAPFEMRGRPMDGWLRVDPSGLGTRRRLAAWVARGVRYARTLPARPGL